MANPVRTLLRFAADRYRSTAFQSMSDEHSPFFDEYA
jgi:hypothetical protein